VTGMGLQLPSHTRPTAQPDQECPTCSPCTRQYLFTQQCGPRLGAIVFVLFLPAGRFGFYRVNYSEPLWTTLAAVATSPQAYISSVDFAGEHVCIQPAHGSGMTTPADRRPLALGVANSCSACRGVAMPLA